MVRICFFIIVCVGVGCDVKKAPNPVVSEVDTVRKDSSIMNLDSLPGETYPVRLATPMKGIGVVEILFSKSKNLKPIRMIRKDGSLFAEIDILKNEVILDGIHLSFSSADNLILAKTRLLPRIIDFEYETLIFDCIVNNEQYFEVVVDQETGTTCRIPADNANVRFHTWQDFLSKVYISFDSKTNPLKSSPFLDAQIIYGFNDFFFKVVEINGDWMKISCNDDCKQCAKGKLTGWIKWREGNDFLIQIGLIC